MSTTYLPSVITALPAVTLGKTTYTVEQWDHSWVADGQPGASSMTVLTGPRGAQYHLRGFLGEDNGLRQVISLKSGQPLRVHGNEVRVLHLGDVIEVA